jgi:hypothetical protein
MEKGRKGKCRKGKCRKGKISKNKNMRWGWRCKIEVEDEGDLYLNIVSFSAFLFIYICIIFIFEIFPFCLFPSYRCTTRSLNYNEFHPLWWWGCEGAGGYFQTSFSIFSLKGTPPR